jgi:hypothetical protein
VNDVRRPDDAEQRTTYGTNRTSARSTWTRSTSFAGYGALTCTMVTASASA